MYLFKYFCRVGSSWNWFPSLGCDWIKDPNLALVNCNEGFSRSYLGSPCVCDLHDVLEKYTDFGLETVSRTVFVKHAPDDEVFLLSKSS